MPRLAEDITNWEGYEMYDTLTKLQELFAEFTDYRLSFMVLIVDRSIQFNYTIFYGLEEVESIRNSFPDKDTSAILSFNREVDRIKIKYKRYSEEKPK